MAVRCERRCSSFPRRRESSFVILAQAGIQWVAYGQTRIQQFFPTDWTPACAWVTGATPGFEFYHGLSGMFGR
ncbi:MAG: hypothetical protein IT449_18440 [Phycisphaerales bacterium]|nr:hypothetical protein [Phycisphaerales bacterium]